VFVVMDGDKQSLMALSRKDFLTSKDFMVEGVEGENPIACSY